MLLAAALAAVAVPGLAAPPSASADTWCGAETQSDRPDTLGGHLVHVLDLGTGCGIQALQPCPDRRRHTGCGDPAPLVARRHSFATSAA
jgi:hypothetical protein